MGDVGDVDAAGGDVGGDQGVDLAVLEAGQGPLALALGLVPVHRDCLQLAAAESLDEPVGTALGPHEDQRAPPLAVAQLTGQVVELGALGVDVDEAVLDFGLRALGGLGVAMRLARVGGRELAGGALERRREEEGLAVCRGLGDDPARPPA